MVCTGSYKVLYFTYINHKEREWNPFFTFSNIASVKIHHRESYNSPTSDVLLIDYALKISSLRQSYFTLFDISYLFFTHIVLQTRHHPKVALKCQESCVPLFSRRLSSFLETNIFKYTS